jgi:hypothetical protein
MSLVKYEDSKKLILNNNKYKKRWKRYNHISIYINYKSIFLHKLFSINSLDKTMLRPLL